MSVEGVVIDEVWACSKSCQSPSDMVNPVITSDGKVLRISKALAAVYLQIILSGRYSPVYLGHYTLNFTTFSSPSCTRITDDLLPELGQYLSPNAISPKLMKFTPLCVYTEYNYIEPVYFHYIAAILKDQNF